MVACTAANGSVTLEVQGSGGLPTALGGLSLGSAERRLTLRAKACPEALAAIEVVAVFSNTSGSRPALNFQMPSSQARIHQFGSQVGNKLLQRLRTLQDVLLELRQQVEPHPPPVQDQKSLLQPLLLPPPPLQPLDSRVLEAVTSAPLRVAQRLEGLLGRRGGALVLPGQSAPLHRLLTESLPRFLDLLQRTSLLGQQELRSESRWRAPPSPLPSTLLLHFKDGGLDCVCV